MQHALVKDIPGHAHLAILYEESISYDDGYGETTNTTFLKYLVIDSESELANWVQDNDTRDYSRKKYQIIRANPVQVEKTVTFHFSE